MSSAPVAPQPASPSLPSLFLRAWVLLQLVLLVGVAHVFRLESRGFLELLVMASIGYGAYQLVPSAWRLRAFTVLSLLTYGWILGWLETALLLAIGWGVLALVLLPKSWRARLGLAVVLLGTLLWVRSGGSGPGALVPAALWPIFGAMFMFRLPLFLEDLRHHPEIARRTSTLAYFFLLPNVCFPLFPVIDSKRFRLGFRPEAPPALAQKGLGWMLRGVSHLLLYRLVYHHVTLDPAAVGNAADLLRYMLGAYLLYLRVSGQFHLIVGLLLLFGFDLPPTHNRYFLASSLSDFWRRINIYWKDFMAKSFFFPCHDWLRRFGTLGTRGPVILATAWVFFCTWALHAYQWAWLTGSWTFGWNDALFWGLLGILVIADQLREAVRPARRLAAGRQTPGQRLSHGLRVARTFLLLTTLWSLWSTDSVSQWLDLWRRAPGLAPTLVALYLVLSGLATWLETRGANGPRSPRLSPSSPTPWAPVPRAAGVTGALLALLALGQPGIYGALGPTAAGVVESLGSARLNAADARTLERGYYENLMAVQQHNPGLHQAYTGRPASWLRIDQVAAWRPGTDLRMGELVPGAEIEFKGARLTVNQHGMRDRPYALAKAPGTLRLAFLGSSHTMGSGVGDDETFENLLENHLTRSGLPVESLNFAVAGHSVVEDLIVLEQKALSFAPDVVVQVAHTHDLRKLGRYLARIVHQGRPIEAPELLQRLAFLDPAEPPRVLEQRLRPHLRSLLAWTYRQIADTARASGARPLWVFLPLLEGESPREVEDLLTLAHDAGFKVYDLRHVYQDHPISDLRLAPWDYHPNARAHQLVAQTLLPAIETEIRPLDPP